MATQSKAAASQGSRVSTAESRSPTVRSEDEMSTVRAGGSSYRSSAELHQPCSSIKVRFSVAVSVLASMGLSVLLAQRMLSSTWSLLRLIGMLGSAFVSFFGYEWCWIHSSALTRQKRAHFDEVNILETYQPRARTHGHLFQPDPPTPGLPVVKFQEDAEMLERSAAEKATFNANRDAHYANMFEYAMRVAKEQEAMEKAAAKKSPAAASPGTKTALEPTETLDIKVSAVKESSSTRTAVEKKEEASTKTAAAKQPSSTRTASAPKNRSTEEGAVSSATPTLLVTETIEDSPATAIPKEASVRAPPQSTELEGDALPTARAANPASPSIEEFTARDVNDRGEPLYENIDALDTALPSAPRPSAVEKLRDVAGMIARNVSSKVRTAVDTSFRGGVSPDPNKDVEKKE